MAFQVGAFQVDAFQTTGAPGVVVEPPVAPPPSIGGVMRAGGGRWARVGDGSVVHLQASDCTAFVLLDRPALGIERIEVAVGVLLDRPAVGLLARLSAGVVDILASGDRPAVGRDDLPEVARLLKMKDKAAKPQPAKDVSRIWALIDALRGKN